MPCLLNSVPSTAETFSGGHPASYSVVAGSFSLEGKVSRTTKLSTDVCVLCSRMVVVCMEATLLLFFGVSHKLFMYYVSR
jgi:hypothetical protein